MKKKIIQIVILCVFLVACAHEKLPQSNQEWLYHTQKKFNEMQSYSCEIKTILQGNKNSQEYVMKQWFKKPNIYRIEVVSPENLKGKLTISKEGKAWIYHPAIEQTWMIEKNLEDNHPSMFLGYFLENCLKSEQVDLSKEKVEGKECLVIEMDLPGQHAYYEKERLFIDIKTVKPYKLEVLDEKDEIRTTVYYTKFEYNPKLNEDLFQIKK